MQSQQDVSAVLHLLQQSQQPQASVKMIGRVRPIAVHYRCPICNEPFQEYSRLGYCCKEHLTTPRKFYIDIWVKKRLTYFTDENGIPFDSYGVALAFLEKLNDHIKADTFEAEKFRPEDVKKYHLKTIWEDYKGHTLDGESVFTEGYSNCLKNVQKHIFDFFKTDTDIRTITAEKMHDYLLFLITRIAKIDTAKLYCRYLISCLNAQHHKTKIHHVMPTLGSAVSLKAKGQRKKKYIPTIAETAKILSCVVDEKFRLAFKFNLLQSIRICELRPLRAGDINFTDETVTISRSAGVKKIRDYTKTGQSYTIPLHPDIVEDMKRVCMGLLPDEYVFAKTTKGQRRIYTHVSLFNVWDDARRNAGLEHCQLYSGLRHSGASEIANISGDLQGTSKYLNKYGDAKPTLIYTARRDMEKMRELQTNLKLPE